MTVNMNEIKVMISQEWQKVMQQAVRWPYGVWGRDVGNMQYNVPVVNQATGCASQHIWCLSQARINWECGARKGIRHKNSGDGRGVDTN